MAATAPANRVAGPTGDSLTATAARLPTAPAAPNPARDTLPDIVPLPAYAMGIATIDGRDLLRFSANTWNRGPGPLVIKGYRIPGTETMNAYQVFYRNGLPVGSALIGQMVFDHDVGHNHWHFKDFTSYDMTDASRRVVATSGKESWCLAPTDVIDLTVTGAAFRPESTGLASSCGGVDAQSLAEVLPVGWGDTYIQSVAGQAIDVTDVPNGRYYVRVTVNPNRKLREASTANNVAYRLVILGGTRGLRTVRVPPYQGVNTG